MLTREIMTQKVDCVTPEDTLRKAARIMRDSDVGMVPVIDADDGMHLTGVITDRDIAVRHVAEGHGPECHVAEAMTRKHLVTVSPEEDVDNVMRRMRDAQVRRVPVVHDGRLVGVVAQADLARRTADDAEVGQTVERISEPTPRH